MFLPVVLMSSCQNLVSPSHPPSPVTREPPCPHSYKRQGTELNFLVTDERSVQAGQLMRCHCHHCLPLSLSATACKISLEEMATTATPTATTTATTTVQSTQPYQKYTPRVPIIHGAVLGRLSYLGMLGILTDWKFNDKVPSCVIGRWKRHLNLVPRGPVKIACWPTSDAKGSSTWLLKWINLRCYSPKTPFSLETDCLRLHWTGNYVARLLASLYERTLHVATSPGCCLFAAGNRAILGFITLPVHWPGWLDRIAAWASWTSAWRVCFVEALPLFRFIMTCFEASMLPARSMSRVYRGRHDKRG